MGDDKRQAKLDKIKESYSTPAGSGDADYDPHKYRDVPRGTNYFQTTVHVLKASLGTGVLAMPFAFKEAGMINGIAFTLIIGIICTYGLHLLARSQYILCKRLRVPYLTYPVSMEAALLVGPKCLSCMARASAIVVDLFLIIYQVGTCAVYIIFIIQNIKKMMDDLIPKTYSFNEYTFMVLPFFIFIMSIPDLKYLAPFSLFSNILTFITFGILLYYIFKDLGPVDVTYFGNVKNFPLFIGTCLFAVAAVGVVSTVEKNMETPSQFGAKFGVLNVSMAIIVIFYAFIGFLGYWRYAASICPVITGNLPKKQLAAHLIQILYAIAIYVSYGLNGYVPVEIIWNNYLSATWRESTLHYVWEYLLRYIMVALTIVLALLIPLLDLIISLFGSLCMSVLELIFPALMDLCVKWPDELGRGKWVLVTDLVIIICGLVGLISGTYTSVAAIVSALRGTSPPPQAHCVD